MPDRELSIWRVLRDLQSGMGGKALREKYKLSPEGLRDLYDQLEAAGLIKREPHKWGFRYVIPRERQISTRNLVLDIRAGLTNTQLMERYKLSEAGLQAVLSKLISAGAMTRKELYSRFVSVKGNRNREKLRGNPRKYPTFEIPVQVVGDLETEGWIQDISEKGVRIRGIPTQVEESRTFAVVASYMSPVRPFVFEAVCRWSRTEPDGDFVAGFEIPKISDQNLEQLLNLMQTLTLGD